MKINMFSFISGPPSPGFCQGKPDGRYTPVGDLTRFFSCVGGHPFPCLTCPLGLLYMKDCDKCLRPGESCGPTKSPPTCKYGFLKIEDYETVSFKFHIIDHQDLRRSSLIWIIHSFEIFFIQCRA